jgi:hypothetical protein
MLLYSFLRVDRGHIFKMGFILDNSTINIPKITDLFNNTTGPSDVARVLTYAWIYVLGGWFFAAVIGALAAALYIKYNNAMVPVVFLILMLIFYGSVLTALPFGFPAADTFVYIVVVIAAFSIGFLLYKLFIKE